MEKRSAHYQLSMVRELIQAGRVTAAGEVDLKLTVRDGVLIVSFKEL